VAVVVVVVATTTTVYRYRIGMEIFIEDGNENVQGTHIQICITTRMIK